MKMFKDLGVLAFAICIALTPGLYPLVMATRKDRIRPNVIILLVLSVIVVGITLALWRFASIEHWRNIWKVTAIIVITAIINVALSHRIGYGPKYGRVLGQS